MTAFFIRTIYSSFLLIAAISPLQECFAADSRIKEFSIQFDRRGPSGEESDLGDSSAHNTEATPPSPGMTYVDTSYFQGLLNQILSATEELASLKIQNEKISKENALLKKMASDWVSKVETNANEAKKNADTQAQLKKAREESDARKAENLDLIAKIEQYKNQAKKYQENEAQKAKERNILESQLKAEKEIFRAEVEKSKKAELARMELENQLKAEKAEKEKLRQEVEKSKKAELARIALENQPKKVTSNKEGATSLDTNFIHLTANLPKWRLHRAAIIREIASIEREIKPYTISQHLPPARAVKEMVMSGLIKSLENKISEILHNDEVLALWLVVLIDSLKHGFDIDLKLLQSKLNMTNSLKSKYAKLLADKADPDAVLKMYGEGSDLLDNRTYETTVLDNPKQFSDKSIKFNITRNNTTIVFNQYVALHQQNQIDEPTKYCGFYALYNASILQRNVPNEAKDRSLFKKQFEAGINLINDHRKNSLNISDILKEDILRISELELLELMYLANKLKIPVVNFNNTHPFMQDLVSQDQSSVMIAIIERFIEKYEKWNKVEKHVFIGNTSASGSHWIAFSMSKNNNKIYLTFFDSLGQNRQNWLQSELDKGHAAKVEIKNIKTANAEKKANYHQYLKEKLDSAKIAKNQINKPNYNLPLSISFDYLLEIIATRPYLLKNVGKMYDIKTGLRDILILLDFSKNDKEELITLLKDRENLTEGAILAELSPVEQTDLVKGTYNIYNNDGTVVHNIYFIECEPHLGNEKSLGIYLSNRTIIDWWIEELWAAQGIPSNDSEWLNTIRLLKKHELDAEEEKLLLDKLYKLRSFCITRGSANLCEGVVQLLGIYHLFDAYAFNQDATNYILQKMGLNDDINIINLLKKSHRTPKEESELALLINRRFFDIKIKMKNNIDPVFSMNFKGFLKMYGIKKINIARIQSTLELESNEALKFLFLDSHSSQMNPDEQFKFNLHYRALLKKYGTSQNTSEIKEAKESLYELFGLKE